MTQEHQKKESDNFSGTEQMIAESLQKHAYQEELQSDLLGNLEKDKTA